MLTNLASQRFLIRNAGGLLEAKYTWERSVAMLEEVYRRVVDWRDRETRRQGEEEIAGAAASTF